MKGWLGLRADTGLDFGGSRLSLAAYGRLAALGGDRAIDLPVSFVGTTTPLTVAGASTGTFGVDLGAAANYHLAPNAEIFVTYEAQLRDNFVAQTAAGGLKIAF